MAVDEALLESSARLGPTVRIYGWSEPAATFGYFQSYDLIAGLTAVRPLVRRPTAGGLVLHVDDWTYSLSAPPQHEWWWRRAQAGYRTVHEWLQGAFALVGLATSLAPQRDPAGPGQCFIGAEPDDLLRHGQKIAGAAQRRNRLGWLLQGSVQPPPPGLRRNAWSEAMRAVAQDRFGFDFSVSETLPSVILRRAEELVRLKYSPGAPLAVDAPAVQ